MKFENIRVDCVRNTLDQDLNWILAELDNIGAMPINITRCYDELRHTEITFNKSLFDEILDRLSVHDPEALKFFEDDCAYIYRRFPCDCCGELDEVVSVQFANSDTYKFVQAVTPDISDEWVAAFGMGEMFYV